MKLTKTRTTRFFILKNGQQTDWSFNHYSDPWFRAIDKVELLKNNYPNDSYTLHEETRIVYTRKIK